MRRFPLIIARLGFGLVAIAGLGSCTNVKQFQRAYLAEYVMAPVKDPLAKGMANHMYFSREGAYGGEGVGGGGCGCN